MISRRSTAALAFATLATLSVAVTAEVRHADLARPVAQRSVATPMVVIDLPRVVVTGRVQREAVAP